MANKNTTPIADELKRNLYRKAVSGVGATAQGIATKQTGIGAGAQRIATKQTGIGAGAQRNVTKQTGIGAGANRTVANTASPVTVKNTTPTATAKPQNTATVKPETTTKVASASVTPAAASAPAVTVPYETDEQIRARYGKDYTDFIAQKEAEAERLRQQYNNQYDTAQRANYVNYMMTQRDLPRRLAEQGITGGMSETANLQSRTNYENLYAGTEGQRRSALQGVDNDYSDALYNYKAQADANMNTELAENRQLRSEYEQQLQQQNEERFVNTLDAYDTLAKVEAAKQAAIANGEAWKVPYFDKQASTLRQQAEATKQAEHERAVEEFVNTIDRFDTVDKCDKAIAAAKKNGEDWKVKYISQHKASLKQQGKAEKQAEQERREQRYVNNIGRLDTVEKCDAEIKRIKKSGKNLWRVSYVQKQKADLKQQEKVEKQARTERYEERYKNTISGWNSIDAINREIKRIKKSGKNLWKVDYLRARRTELINAGQTGSSSGGSSSGGKSSGRSGGGGGGGGGADTPKQETATTQQEEKKPKTEKSPIKKAQELATAEAKKKWKKKVKEAKKKGGLTHTGNKKPKTKVSARAMWR